MGLVGWILLFAVGAVVLSRAGVELARSGNQIAVGTGASGLAVGAVLMAAATSLPEVVTAVSAALADAPDVAVGDLFGSNMANMAILAVIDLQHHGGVWPRVELGHARIGSVAVGLTALAAFSLVAPDAPAIGWVGVDTIVIVMAYLAAVAWFRRSPDSRWSAGVLPRPTGWGTRAEVAEAATRGERSTAAAGTRPLRTTAARFAVAAVVVLVSAPVVAVSAREIAAETGIEQTVVGVVLVAIATSLPELVASIAAVRIGAHDLAVGNLLGSNAANMAIFVVIDVAYTPGPLLAAVDPTQTVAAVGAIVLMSLALAAIVHGEETTVRRFEPDAIVLLIAYAAVLGAVFAVQP